MCGITSLRITVWSLTDTTGSIRLGEERLNGTEAAADLLYYSHHHFLGHPQLAQNDMRGECLLVPKHAAHSGDAGLAKLHPRLIGGCSCNSTPMSMAPVGNGRAVGASTTGLDTRIW